MKTVKELNDQVHNFTVSQLTIDMVQDVYRKLNDEEGYNNMNLGAFQYDVTVILEIINPELKEDIQVLTDIYEALEQLITK